MSPPGNLPENRKPTPGKDGPFYVPPLLDLLGGLVQHYRDFWLGLGRLESSLLAEKLAAIPIVKPIFIAGLARSGSTLLHEVTAAHAGTATHRVKDYPMVFTPYWWRRATIGLRPSVPRERPHHDKILITTDSPDALEEMLWLAFFPACHNPAVSNVLTATAYHPDFETFYLAHIRKLLLAEQATRYVAKANYHVARLSYLLRLFPDARLIVPVRAPVDHIASLMRQHRWFSQGQRSQPRALAYMQRSGHFEFGLDRRPINLGDSQQVQEIVHAWTAGEEVRGWARYWNMVHGYLADSLADDAQVRRATLVVRFEALCDAPAEQLRILLEHCGLPEVDRIVARFAPTIRRPDYYKSGLTTQEIAVIEEETHSAKAKL